MQFGFRANHSTTIANCFLVENIKAKLDKGGAVCAVFLDLRKAFGTVHHNIRITKMAKFNYSSSALCWFKSYLENRNHCVRIKDVVSPILSCTVGVPRDSILGLLLFSLYINDLPSACCGAEVQMYADDTVIYIHGKSCEEAAH